MSKIRNLIVKYSELIQYVVFGVLTTAVNLIVFKLFNIILGEDKYLISNIIAWIFAVAFAYVTNKLFVFKSKSWAFNIIKKEIPSFIGARVFSFLIEEFGLFIFVDLLKFNKISLPIFSFNISGEMIAKIILAVIVVVLNYIFSKLFIFKKKS